MIFAVEVQIGLRKWANYVLEASCDDEAKDAALMEAVGEHGETPKKFVTRIEEMEPA